jgi:hypothetical protein
MNQSVPTVVRFRVGRWHGPPRVVSGRFPDTVSISLSDFYFLHPAYCRPDKSVSPLIDPVRAYFRGFGTGNKADDKSVFAYSGSARP